MSRSFAVRAVGAFVLVVVALVGLWRFAEEQEADAVAAAVAAARAERSEAQTAEAVAPFTAQLADTCATPEGVQALRRQGVSCTAVEAAQEQVREAVEYVPIPGPPGPPGADGVDGQDGRPGRTGDRGPQGGVGLTCVEELGLEQCRGPQGDPGPPGDAGPAGPAGPQGERGPQGTATPGSYSCPDGSYVRGFTIGDGGGVALDCRPLPDQPAEPTPAP